MKKFFVVLLLGIMLLMMYLSSNAEPNSLDDAKKKINEINKEKDSIDKKKQEYNDEIEKYEDEIDKIQEKENEKKNEINELNSDVDKLELAVNGIENKEKVAEEEYNSQMKIFQKRLCYLYQNTDYRYSYIEAYLSSENILEVYSKIKLISEIAEKEKQIMNNAILAKKEYEESRELLEELKAAKVVEYNSKKDELETLKESKSETSNEIGEIKDTLKILEKREDTLNAESKKVSSYISKIVDKKTNYTGGEMTWPVPSSRRITSGYGNRVHPIFGTVKFHSGIDIGAPRGVSIVAANSGKIVYSGWKTGYGYTLIIDHGGKISTLYGHCSKLLVGKGENVKAGQTVAKIGSTGWSTGPHLHFEIIKGDSKGNFNTVNPINYLK